MISPIIVLFVTKEEVRMKRRVATMALVGLYAVATAFAGDVKSIRVLAIGNGFSVGALGKIQKVAKVAECPIDLVCSGEGEWQPALKSGDWDAIVLWYPAHLSLDRAALQAWGDKLVANIRERAPKAEIHVQQVWSDSNADPRICFDMYDRLASDCTGFAVRNDLEIIPTGFAIQAFRGELPVVGPAGDVVGVGKDMGCLNARGEYLQACVWVAKLFGVDIRKLDYAPAELGDADELAVMRRCAQEAVNIMTPIPVCRCAEEAIGKMTPVPVEQEWWKKRLADKKKEIAKLNGEVDLVFVGSSQIHIWETRCPTQLKDIHRDFTLLNLGYSGDSFQKVCWRLTKGGEMDGYKAKCIMLLQGGNNTDETPTALALGMKQILDVFAAKQPQAKVLLLPINPRREWDAGTAPRPRPRVDRANEILRRYADGKHVIWCDFREELYDENDDTLWVMPKDRLHAGTEGLKIWYSHIKPFFHEICGKPLPPKTEGWTAAETSRKEYEEGEFVWAANLKKRGGFVFEKRDGAEGKIEIEDGQLMIHKTNDKGYLLVHAHPFASHTHVKLRLYSDVYVADAEPGLSHGFLRAHDDKESLGILPEFRNVDPAGGWDIESGLDIHPEGCYYRKYVHYRTDDGNVRPVIVVAGSVSKTFWKNWRAEEVMNPKKCWRKVVHKAGAADERLTLAVEKLSAKPVSPWRPDVALVIDEAGQGGLTTTPAFADLLNAKQLEFLESAGVPYVRHTAAEVLAKPELLKGTRMVVFMLMRTFDAPRIALVKSLAAPGKTLVFLSECGVLGGFEEATGFKIDFSRAAKTHETASDSQMWKDLAPGAFEGSLIRSYAFGEDVAKPLPAPMERRASVVREDGMFVFAHFADDKSPAIAMRRDTKGCRYICIATAGGLTPDYFNRLVRESNAYAPVDETGLKVEMNGDVVSVRALRTGRFDFKLPFPCKVRNLKSGKEEPLKGDILPLNLTAGETCLFGLKN